VGFARNTVMSVAGKVIELVKAGKIKHFFLVGGCDGAKRPQLLHRVCRKSAQDCVVLTLAAASSASSTQDLGAIDGIPRLLDIGQCKTPIRPFRSPSRSPRPSLRGQRSALSMIYRGTSRRRWRSADPPVSRHQKHRLGRACRPS